jgi:hypothetical protein
VPEASVLASNVKTSAINAALVDGMLAESDESDDFEPARRRRGAMSRHSSAKK